MRAATPPDEAARLAELRRLHVLDTPPDAALDGLARAAAAVCRTPIALLSFIDEHRQWFKARVGLDDTELPRAVAFCAHTILGDDLLVVQDTLDDPRFADNPLALGASGLRFYAGMPIRSAGGHAIGALCVVDRVPRTLAEPQREVLRVLARSAEAELDRGRAAPPWEAATRDPWNDAPFGAYELDASGTFTRINDMMLRWLGETREAVVGLRRIYEFSTADAEARFKDVTRGGAVGRAVGERPLVRRDGSVLWTWLNGEALLDAQGRPVGIRATLTDITERHEAEVALRQRLEDAEARLHRQGRDVAEADARLQGEVQPRGREEAARRAVERRVGFAFEAGGIGLWIWDVRTGHIEWHGRHSSLLGVPDGAFDGTYAFFERCVHPDDRALIVAAVEKARDERTDYQAEFRVVWPNGEVHWIKGRGRFSYDADGPAVMSGIILDITERKRAELEGAAVHRRMVALLEGTSNGFVALDRDLRYTYVNRRAAGAVGLRPEQMIGRTIREVFPGGEGAAFERPCRRALDEQVPTQVVEFFGPTGRWFESRILPVDGGLSVFSRDVTARRKAEQEALAARDRLRSMAAHLQVVREEESARIAREIHDDLGQSLTALKIELSLIERRFAELLSEGDGEAFRDSVRSTRDLVDGTVRSVRRIAANLRPTLLDDFGLFAAVSHLAQDLEARMGMTCEVVGHVPGVPRHIESTAFRIAQEALTNVARHSGATSAQVSLAEEPGWLIVTTRDNGRGFVEPVTDTLGLIGMRERAEVVGGTLDVESAPGRGTTVRARLPLPEAPA